MSKGIIIVRYSGVSRQPAFSVNGDGDDLKISVIDPERGKEEEIIFTGDDFSQEQFEKHGGKEKEDLFFKGFKK